MPTSKYKIDNTGFYKSVAGVDVLQVTTNGFLAVSTAKCTVQVRSGVASVSKGASPPIDVTMGAYLGDGYPSTFANNADTPETTYVATTGGSPVTFVVLE